MRSKASIKGHPIHPMLIPIPIGLLVGSLVADLIYMADGSLFWYDMAWWAMAFGVVGALVAAIPGLIDYNAVVKRDRKARAIGLAHMIINLSVVGLYLLNLALRYNHLAASGPMFGATLALSVIAILALSASGWLGGELVYRFGVGMGGGEPRVTIAPETAEERTHKPH